MFLNIKITKNPIKLILFVFFVLNVNGLTARDTLKNESKSIEITQLNDSLSKLHKQIEILHKNTNLDSEILENRIKQASETISNQNSLISGFGVMYTVITLVIAFIGVALPILTYQFGIKPSQDALKEFERNSDQKLKKFLTKERSRQIEQAIENLESQNFQLKADALSYLSLTAYQGFSDDQLFRLFKILKSNCLDSNSENQIIFILSNKVSIFATEYFSNAIFSENINTKYAALKYFLNFENEKFIYFFKELISRALDKKSEILTLCLWVSNLRKEVVIDIFDNKEIIGLLNETELDEFIKLLSIYKTTWGIDEEIFNNLYLFNAGKR